MARRPKKSDELKEGTSEKEVTLTPTEEGVIQEPESMVADAPKQDAQYSQCGGVLSAERVKQDLSTKDVAKQLRLSNTQIEALEQDDYESLPEATIVKGFIRNYAKLLKVPAESLLDAYVQMVPVKEDYSFSLNPGINMKITESRKTYKLRYFLIVAAFLLGAGIWFFYQNYVQKPSPINPMPEVVEALPELALPMSERVQNTASTQLEMPGQQKMETNESNEQESLVVSEVVSEKTTDVEAVLRKETEGDAEALIVDKTLASQEVVKPEAMALEAVVPETVTNNAPPALGKTRLAFTATQETWVSVVNTSGREVFNKILYAGNRELIDVRNPSEIVVGNAHGATLSIGGKTIDLAPYTRVNVARVRMNRLR